MPRSSASASGAEKDAEKGTEKGAEKAGKAAPKASAEAPPVAAAPPAGAEPKPATTPPPPDLLQPIIRRAAPQIEAMMQLIVFGLGNEEYAVRIGQVKEITVTPEIARMPRTPPLLRGVANIRGELIAVLDLEERFQMTRPAVAAAADVAAEGRSYTLVVEAADYAIGLLVSVMPTAINVPVSLLERAPDFLQSLPAINDKYIEGFIRLPDSDRVVILLDVLRLLKPEEILQLPTTSAVSEGGRGGG